MWVIVALPSGSMLVTGSSTWVRGVVVGDDVVKANPSECCLWVEDDVAELYRWKSEKSPSVSTPDVASSLSAADVYFLSGNYR